MRVEPKVDQQAAKKAGKDAGETIAKETKEAVRKSSPGKDLAKVIVDGIAEGAKRELRDGGVGEVIVDGIAEGVKQGIDGDGIGGQVVDAIGGGIKSKNLGGTIKDAVLPSISEIGTAIRANAGEWSGSIVDGLRSGSISAAVADTTDTIATIGETFGLQLDEVRVFGEQASSTLSAAGGVIDNVLTLKDTLTDTGTLLGDVLPGRAGSGAKSIIASLGTIVPVAIGVYEALDRITQDWHADQQDRFWQRQQIDQRLRDLGVKPPQPGVGDFGGPPAVGQGSAPSRPSTPGALTDLRAKISAGQMPGYSIGPGGAIIGPDGKPIPGLNVGGYTGNFPIDAIAGVVHGGEFVVKKRSTDRLMNDYPGLLDALNGYEDGGRVPYGLPRGTNTGGYGSSGPAFPDWVHAIEKRFGVKASTYGGHQEDSGSNKGIDWVGSVPAMQAFAEYLASIRGELEQVIWQNPQTGQKIGVFNGELVGPGTSQPGYYRDDWADHRDHVHTRQSFSFGGLSSTKPPVDVRPKSAAVPAAMGPPPVTAPASASTPSSTAGVSMPSTLSGLSGWGLNMMGTGKNEKGNRDPMAYFGPAASAAVSGQVASALDVFGIGDSPGWLQGISKLVSGIQISGPSGAATPTSAAPLTFGAPDLSGVRGSGASQQTGPVYNIRTATVEDAFLQARRKEDQRMSAKLSVY